MVRRWVRSCKPDTCNDTSSSLKRNQRLACRLCRSWAHLLYHELGDQILCASRRANSQSYFCAFCTNKRKQKLVKLSNSTSSCAEVTRRILQLSHMTGAQQIRAQSPVWPAFEALLVSCVSWSYFYLTCECWWRIRLKNDMMMTGASRKHRFDMNKFGKTGSLRFSAACDSVCLAIWLGVRLADACLSNKSAVDCVHSRWFLSIVRLCATFVNPVNV